MIFSFFWVRQKLIIILFLLGLSCHEIYASAIINLSTGIDSNGDLINFGNTDDNWQVTTAPGGVSVNNSVTVVPPSRPYFINYEPEARWISPNAQTNDDAPWGFYTYETNFFLDMLPSFQYSINGEYSADNRLINIMLNGNLAFTGPYASAVCPWAGCEEFVSVTDFLIEDPSFFNDGLNTLSVIIENQGPTSGNPTSFAMRAYVNQTNAVPESSTASLLVAGLSMIGLLIRGKTAINPR